MSKREVNYVLANLTDGERLWARRKWGGHARTEPFTQYEMCVRMGISHRMYVDMELGRRPVPSSMLRGADILWDARCLLALARRRSGLGLTKVAQRLGLSHQGYLNRERTGDTRLVNYWRGVGFKF